MSHQETMPAIELSPMLRLHMTRILPAEAYWEVYKGIVDGQRPLEGGGGLTAWGTNVVSRRDESSEAMSKEQVQDYADIDRALRTGYIGGADDKLFETTTTFADNTLFSFEHIEERPTDIINAATALRTALVAERRSRITTRIHELNLVVAGAEGTLWAKTASFRDQWAAQIIGFQLSTDQGRATPKVETVLRGKGNQYGVSDMALASLHMHVA